MFLLVVSFIAGVLTALAPCVLPLLPIIIGGSVAGRRARSAVVIALSLSASIILFTLVLKFSTALIDIPPLFWRGFSGVIIILFGIASLWPRLWDTINFKFGLSSHSESLLAGSGKISGRRGDILLGAALGPVFSSCSPTYFLILATVLPSSFWRGLIYLVAYAAGLSLVLLLISWLGQKLLKNTRALTNPDGWFKRFLGALFIVVGVLIIFGLDKNLQTFLIERGYYRPSNWEERLLKKASSPSASLPINSALATLPVKITMPTKFKTYPRYTEIFQPAGFINSEPFTIGQFIGKKVVLVDFMTYSCINCIRTFPYLNAWYDKYKDQGLAIIGIHTPEFAFEHKLENVQKALGGFGIKFPVVLDNDYATWQAYRNNYWPRKYLIDIDGYVVYDHIGEGNYEETETKIQELLAEKMSRELVVGNVPTGVVTPTGTKPVEAGSPETYFGAARNKYLATGQRHTIGLQTMPIAKNVYLNELNLAGTWDFTDEHAEAKASPARIIYRYSSRAVYLVASSIAAARVRVLLDNKPLTLDNAGSDIKFENGQSYFDVQEERLYDIINDSAGKGEHTLELIIETPGFTAYAFTFG
ncbi:MAG: cytochrome c biogenesis protein CcdA [Candidatus Magasanikbacteria bacterium]|nr:cytochrome c biogenesis protein CcdA [Candidatus Magasanikbacteria bacterium]